MSNAAPSAFCLDFGTARRAPSGLGWLLLLCGCAAAGLVVRDYLHHDVLLAARQAQVTQLEARLRDSHRTAPPRGDDAALAGDLAVAGGISRELGRDWGALLEQLERAGDTSVALLALQLDAAKGDLKLDGEARDLPAMFEFSRRLGKAANLSGAHVTSYEFRQDGGVRAVAFSLAAHWEDRP